MFVKFYVHFLVFARLNAMVVNENASTHIFVMEKSVWLWQLEEQKITHTKKSSNQKKKS